MASSIFQTSCVSSIWNRKPEPEAKSVATTDPAKPEPSPDTTNEKKEPVAVKSAEPVKETASAQKSEPSDNPKKPSDYDFPDIKETEKDIASRKPDHNGYMEKIRTAAREKVNKEPEVYYAILCKNVTFQDWSLVIYKRKEKSYWFATYSWSEIDGKFDEPMVSNKYPLTGLKNHLNHSSPDRKCETIKGRIE